MGKIIYDVRKDKHLQKIINERTQYFNEEFYVESYGRYGTSGWWANLDNKGLLVTRAVQVEDVMPDGKSTIALLKLKSDENIFEVVMKGKASRYSAGDKLLITMVKIADVFIEKSEGWELLKVEEI